MSGVIDAELVERLLAEQFPQWGAEPVRPVDRPSWDNRVFRIGEDLVARLPSAEGYVAAVAKEQRWLPVLGRQLPQRIPTPVARGRPGCGYPWPWSVYRWLPGASATAVSVADAKGFARDLAAFVAALQRIDSSQGPVAGDHSFGRGGPLDVYDQETRSTITRLGRLIDGPAAMRLWESAVAAPYAGPPVWVHGDLAPSNLLVQAGRLSGVIDFGTCAVGDPACDLVIAWTFLPGAARQVFRQGLTVEESAWTRGRAWALWKALLTLDAPDGGREAEGRYGRRSSSSDLIRDLLAESPP